MSTTAISWAWQQTTRSSGQRLVLLALCDHMADHDDRPGWTAWPSIARLAGMCGLKPGIVRRHLDDLAADGLIVKLERRRRRSGTLGTWIYQIPATATAVAVTTATGVTHESATGVAVDHRYWGGAQEPQDQNRKKEPHARSTKDSRRAPRTALERIRQANASRHTV